MAQPDERRGPPRSPFDSDGGGAALGRGSHPVRISASGQPLANAGGRTVCIVSPMAGAYSETFIRAHVERLPATVRTLTGGIPPRVSDEGRDVCEESHTARAIRWIRARVSPRRRDLVGADDEGRARFLREAKVDVVLAEYGVEGVAMMAACRLANVPLVVHFHGSDAYDAGALHGAGQRYGALFAQAAAIIAVSRHMEGQLRSLGAPREKLVYNTCGADVSLFHGADPERADSVFVSTGRFVEKKAPFLTVLAFARVVAASPNARLIMAGDGPLFGATQRLAGSLGLGDAVQFLGPVSHDRVAELMRSARAFAQHSVQAMSGDCEGTPVAIMEAGASGLPVVATRHTGIVDVIREGETGVLVNEGDVEGMGAAMLRLARHPAEAARMGAQARIRIVKEFSLDASIARLATILDTACRG